MTASTQFPDRATLAALLAAALVLAGCAGKPQVTSSEGTNMTAQLLGYWGSQEKGTPHLELKDDGTVTGTDGCNGISTTYEVEGSTVTFEPFVSTLMGCPGVDTWLRDLQKMEVSGDGATVFNGQGEEIGTLERGVAPEQSESPTP